MWQLQLLIWVDRTCFRHVPTVFVYSCPILGLSLIPPNLFWELNTDPLIVRIETESEEQKCRLNDWLFDVLAIRVVEWFRALDL